MQNLLVIFFPFFIDTLNKAGDLKDPSVKFWVAIISSFIGAMLLNLPAIQAALIHPDFYNVSNDLTWIALLVAATQGIYLKYWENHSVRQIIFSNSTSNDNKTKLAE